MTDYQLIFSQQVMNLTILQSIQQIHHQRYLIIQYQLVLFSIMLKTQNHQPKTLAPTFWNIQIDYTSQDQVYRIFKSFHLESWIAPDYRVKVKYRHKILNQNIIRTVFSFHQQDQQPRKIIYLFQKLAEHGKRKQTQIQYYLMTEQVETNQDDPNDHVPTTQYRIDVYLRQDEKDQKYYIHVQDQSGFITKWFPIKIQKMLKQTSNPYIEQNCLSYNFIEPQKQRNFTISQNHYSLAFQGGGAKGLAYIGAYKSLKEQDPNRKIRSVIGSSAGSIIALAIAAGNDVNKIIGLMSKLKDVGDDRVIKTKDDLDKQQTIQKNKKYIENLKQILHEYGFIHKKLIDSLITDIFTDQVIDKIFNVICGQNPSLRKIFSLDGKPGQKQKLTNYYGIFEAKLLSGDIIRNLSKQIIRDLLLDLINDETKSSKQLVEKVFGKLSSDIKVFVEEKVQKINMKQLYDLTGVEFTCTAVDLNDKIIRFFNQKTTPDLPVYKAVQMSSSFPVVFEAQEWKQDWGYYYIHYQKRRVEVDLKGHKFTDGGVLANLPMKYLGNQKMRPKYFSHQPDSFTKTFGFGLHHVTQQEDLSIQQKNKDQSSAIEDVMSAIKGNISKWKLAWKFWSRPSDVEVSIEDKNIQQAVQKIDSIPVFKFLFQLLQTYQFSNDNLVRECFMYQSYIFQEYISTFQMIQNQKPQNLTKNYQQMKVQFVDFQKDLQKIPLKFVSFDKAIVKLQIYIKQVKPATLKNLTEVSNQIKRILVSYGKFIEETEFQNKTIQSQIDIKKLLQTINRKFNELLRKLNQINEQPIFSKSFDPKNFIHKLDEFLQQIKMAKIIDMTAQNTKKIIQNHLNQFLNYIKIKHQQEIQNILKMIEERLATLSKNPKADDLNQYQETSFNNTIYKKVIDFLQMFEYPLTMLQYKNFEVRLQKLDLGHLKMKIMMKESYVESSLWNYIQSMMQSAYTQSDIHLVFQGIGNSSNYYFYAYNLINQYIINDENRRQPDLQKQLNKIENQTVFKMNEETKKQYMSMNKQQVLRTLKNKNPKLHESMSDSLKRRKKNCKKISAITCGNIHSILGFLICAGFSDDKIQRQINQFKYLLKLDSNAQKKYYEKEWINQVNYKMRRLQDKIWSERYKIFEDLQQTISHNKNIEKSLKDIRYQFEQSKDKVVNGFQQVLDFLIDAQINRPESQDVREYFAKKLLLQDRNRNYYEDAESLASGTQKLIFDVIQMFSQQISLMIISKISQMSPLIQQIKMQKDPKIKKLIWKGYLLDSFMDASNVKKKVIQLLKELNYPKDISLKQFYEVAPKKIDLNFLGIDLQTKRVCFINRHTYPSMPLWAAILISVSYPPLFHSIRGKPQWLQNIHQNLKQKTIYEGFKDASVKNHRTPIFISGMLLSSFPLQIITNNEVQNRYLNAKNEQNQNGSNTPSKKPQTNQNPNQYKYIFLNFGLSLKQNKDQIKYSIIRSFPSFTDVISLAMDNCKINCFSSGSKSPSFDFLVGSSKIKILTTYMESNDQLMLQLYQNNVLLLPIRFNTLDFHMLGQQKLRQLTIEETNLMTNQKLSGRRETYFKINLNANGQFFMYFLSQDVNNKNIETRYNIFYSEYNPEAKKITYIPIKKQVVLKNIPKFILLKFQFIILQNNNKSIKQMVYQLDVQNSLKYKDMTAIYKLSYDILIDDKIHPYYIIGTKKQNQAQIKQVLQKLSIQVKSIVDIVKDKLFCEDCCQNLNPRQGKSEYKKDLKFRGKCKHCSVERPIRLICKKCSGLYCTKCVTPLLIRKIVEYHRLQCVMQGHRLVYISSGPQNSQSVFKVCNICRQYKQQYYEDLNCNMHICYQCVSSIIQDE